jgi:peroxiredoxin
VVLAAGLGLMLMSDIAPAPVTRGAAAPDFELPTLGGGPTLALGDFRGQVVLVNFWATWCKPCEDEIPAMERLYQRLSSEGFELLAVSVDQDEADVVAFRERMAISFPILLDPRQQVSRQYQTTGFPESVLLDREGRVVERYIGPRDWDHRSYVERIRRLLRGDEV